MKYYLAIQNNEILSFATTWMDLDGIMLSEISQRKKIPYDSTHMWKLKKIKKKHTNRIKWKQTHRYREYTSG